MIIKNELDRESYVRAKSIDDMKQNQHLVKNDIVKLPDDINYFIITDEVTEIVLENGLYAKKVLVGDTALKTNKKTYLEAINELKDSVDNTSNINVNGYPIYSALEEIPRLKPTKLVKKGEVVKLDEYLIPGMSVIGIDSKGVTSDEEYPVQNLPEGIVIFSGVNDLMVINNTIYYCDNFTGKEQDAVIVKQEMYIESQAYFRYGISNPDNDSIENIIPELSWDKWRQIYNAQRMSEVKLPEEQIKELQESIENLNLDASKITSGTISIERLPASVLERMTIVQDDTARFKLTTSQVQLGDTVKVTSTNKMYLVVNENKLNEEAGYEVYTAGRASEVPWSGVTGKPETFKPETHTHENYAEKTHNHDAVYAKTSHTHSEYLSSKGGTINGELTVTTKITTPQIVLGGYVITVEA